MEKYDLFDEVRSTFISAVVLGTSEDKQYKEELERLFDIGRKNGTFNEENISNLITGYALVHSHLYLIGILKMVKCEIGIGQKPPFNERIAERIRLKKRIRLKLSEKTTFFLNSRKIRNIYRKQIHPILNCNIFINRKRVIPGMTVK